MSKSLLSLISLLLSVTVAHAAESADPTEPSALNVSGWLTSTAFSSREYYPTLTELAVNATYTLTDTVTLKSAVSSTNFSKVNITRAVVEYHVLQNILGFDTALQVGRYPRINSLYNDITDNPGTYGMATLPQAVYPYSIIKSSLTLADGVNIMLVKPVKDGLLTIKGAIGTGVIVDRELLNLTLVRSNLDWYNVQPKRHQSIDLAIAYETLAWKIVLANGNFPYTSDIPDATDMDINATTLGLSYAWHAFTFEAEGSIHRIMYSNPILGVRAPHDYRAISLTAKYNFAEEWSAYMTHDRGNYPDDEQKFHSTAVGITYDANKWSASAEIQVGKGNHPTSLWSTETNRNVIAVSLTRRF